MSNNTCTASVSAGNGCAYDVILEPSADCDRIWTAEIPALGIVTEGRGRACAERAAASAVQGYHVTAARHAKAIPAGDLQLKTVAAGQRRKV